MHQVVETKNSVPDGWAFFCPTIKHSFEFGTFKPNSIDGQYSAFIECKNKSEEQFGSILQVIDASNFVGRTIKLKGLVRNEVEGADSEIFLEANGSAAMLLKSATFTQVSQDWQQFVLDFLVPLASQTITFGGLLSGWGRLEFNSLEFTTDTETTFEDCEQLEKANDRVFEKAEILQAPSNLDFSAITDGLPEHWNLSGRNVSQYDASTATPAESGDVLLCLRCVNRTHTYAAGQVSQSFEAQEYRGKSVELSAMIEFIDVGNHAGLYLRFNGPTQRLTKQWNEVTTGSADWELRKLALTVPEDVQSITIGIYCEGGGSVSVKHLAVTVLDSKLTQESELVSRPVRPTAPVNLQLR